MNLLAQRGQDFQQRAEERFNRMCEFLGLDENQKKEARKLFDERREEMRKLRDETRSGDLSRQEIREKMRGNSENYRKKLEKLLTDEQKAKAGNVALLASRTNTLLSIPMILGMTAHAHGLPF